MNRVVVLNLLLGLLLPLANVQADQVQLYPQAQVQTSIVRLADVAQLHGSIVSRLGQTVLVQRSGGESLTQVSLQQVRQHLDDLGVDVSRIAWGGPQVCVVTEATHTSVLANPTKAVDTRSALTFEAQLIQYLVTWTGFENSEVVVKFSERDRQRLAQAVGVGRLEFEPAGQGPLGRIPVTIRHWQGGRLMKELRVTAMVARKTLAFVMVKSVKRGQVFGPRDIQIREVLLNRGRSEPLRQLGKVVGQSAQRRLRVGQMLFAEDVAPAVLIHKGQRVTVRCMVGGVLVRTTARAEQDGMMDQTISFRNETPRSTFTARVSSSHEAILVLNTGTSQSNARFTGRGL